MRKAKPSERLDHLNRGKVLCRGCGKDQGSKYALKKHQGYCRGPSERNT